MPEIESAVDPIRVNDEEDRVDLVSRKVEATSAALDKIKARIVPLVEDLLEIQERIKPFNMTLYDALAGAVYQLYGHDIRRREPVEHG